MATDTLYELTCGDARRCPNHPDVKTSSEDGMFDGPCWKCEDAMYDPPDPWPGIEEDEPCVSCGGEASGPDGAPCAACVAEASAVAMEREMEREMTW